MAIQSQWLDFTWNGIGQCRDFADWENSPRSWCRHATRSLVDFAQSRLVYVAQSWLVDATESGLVYATKSGLVDSAIARLVNSAGKRVVNFAQSSVEYKYIAQTNVAGTRLQWFDVAGPIWVAT